MAVKFRSKAMGGIAPVLFAAAGLALAVPTAGLAVSGLRYAAAESPAAEFAPFTPASVDPQLARRVAASVKATGQAIRFTPATPVTGSTTKDRSYIVAVRVDDETARAISVRSAIAGARGTQALSDGGNRLAALAPTRYNLGAARGYQGFARVSSLAKADTDNAAGSTKLGANGIGLLDLAEFKPAEGAADKPSRFQPRIAMEAESGTTGRSKGTLGSLGEQIVDLGGAYRVTRNLDVTAGVRLSQDRDRLAPLTDSVQDSQAVYVGTQFRF